MAHHGAGLRQLTCDEQLVTHLTVDYTQARIGAPDRAMLNYVEKLTRIPGQMCEKDVTALHAVGFSDSTVLDICQVAAYYAFVNRIADGLGVELESS